MTDNKEISESIETEKENIAEEVQTLVAERYLVNISQKLERKSNIYCEVYDSEDVHSEIESTKKDYLAYIFNPKFLPRMRAINLLQACHERGHVLPIISAKVLMSSTKKTHLAVITKKPKGINLTEYISKNGPVPESFLSDILLPSLIKLLLALETIGLGHGSINPENIFIDSEKSIFLDECFSTSVGFSQPRCYEALERMLSHPSGKGEANISTDCFAIGMVCLFVISGQNPGDLAPEREIIQNRLEIGSYQFFVPFYNNISNRVRDLLRGLLTDKKMERWKFSQIEDWCNNRRYNIVNILDSSEASRKIVFNGKHFASFKSLSYSMWVNWEEARLFLKDDALIKWSETSLGDAEKAEKLHHILKLQKVDSNSLQEDENIAKSILILSPENPVLFKEIACDLEGIPSFLVYSFAQGKKEYVDNIIKIITHGIWRGSYSGLNNESRKELVLNLEMANNYLSRKKMGFGVERCLYELCPNLGCQSELFEGNYIDNMESLLLFLDKKTLTVTSDILDAHLSAFLAAKLKIVNEIKLNDIPEFTRFERNKDLIALFLLSSAQKISKTKNLNQLSNLMIAKLQSTLTLFYNKKTKGEIVNQLEILKDKGDLVEIYRIIANQTYIKNDKKGFNSASYRYKKLQQQVENISHPQKIYDIGYRYGLKLSVIISYLILLIFFAFLLSKYLR